MTLKAARGLSLFILDIFKFDAVVSPWRTVYVRAGHETDDALIRHEQCHLDQMDRDGWWAFWFWISAYYIYPGYERSPYEIEARKAEHAD